MKKQTFFTMLILLASIAATAQKQANVWAFGNGSGFNFNGGGPVPISTSLPLGDDFCHWCPSDPTGYNEGASSICDSAGNLLFYSNGEKIWNRFNNPLPHGDSLMGNFSAEQAALILPLPGSNTIFYIFTIDCFQDTFKYGLHYTVVDACLDSGRGDVVPGMKNIPLLDSTGEKLTAVKLADGGEYWIIAHKFWTDAFYCFRLTSSGIVDTVITHIGRVHIDTTHPNWAWAAVGAMVASPNGRHVALVNANMQDAQYLSELFDFDAFTGTLSNYIDLGTRATAIGSREQAYGCSFSPNSSKLYIGGFTDTMVNSLDNTISDIAQYDLSMGTMYPDSVRNSVKWIQAANEDSFEVATHSEFHPNSLQIGPDKKMYASGGGPYLWVIQHPDLAGAACQARVISEFTVGKTLAMPNILPSYAYDNGVTGCSGVSSVPSDPAQINDVSIYPNPAKETFTVNCPGDWQATLTDLSGRYVAGFTGTGSTICDKGKVLPGTYLFSIRTNNIIINKMVVIQ